MINHLEKQIFHIRDNFIYFYESCVLLLNCERSPSGGIGLVHV